MPKVWNMRDPNKPADALYVGRGLGSKYGNPYTHLIGKSAAKFQVKSREEAVNAYEDYLKSNPELLAAAKRELRGKDLICWCAPQFCHADILLRIANEGESND